ncbi:low temperature requirement protein A [Agrococcus sp. SGAir0287]|uniref:low temperature requirement protein A n=1 Tax=Agrococcus sp. SGAir0287 TaxID=2070347 RepID=UPI001585E845|nr:low temperature requirement protein A [Agrococcus sp. SGAir0287]
MTGGWFGLRRDVLRHDSDGDADRVTFIELFFDLVFVFALTQLSAYLYEHQDLLGALEGVIMVCALWWVWISTTWVTNWLDPEHLPVRSAVVALAFVAFVLSVSIAESFGDRAWAFAIAYVVLQLGRTAFLAWATWRHDRELAELVLRLLFWVGIGAVLWIAGALLPLPAQLPMWCAALVVDYVAASTGYRTPGLGRAPMERWDVTGTHIAERAALFVLIALGESFLVTGFAFVATETTPASVATMVSAFAAAAAMWWIYFDHGERMGSEAIARSKSPGRLARTAYTYVHLAVIAGIVLMSVADKEMLSHPDEPSLAASLAILGGPALFLTGTVLFRSVLERRWMPTQLAGIGALAAAGALAPFVPPVVLGVTATLVLVAVAAAESVVRLREGRRSGG